MQQSCKNIFPVSSLNCFREVLYDQSAGLNNKTLSFDESFNHSWLKIRW